MRHHHPSRHLSPRLSGILPPLRRFALAASLLICLGAGPARATLEQTLAPFPDDTMALVTISLDPANWSFLIEQLMAKGKVKVQMDAHSSQDAKASKADKADKPGKADPAAQPKTQELPDELKTVMAFLKDDLKFDPIFDGLANLGSHLTLAYHPYPGTQGQVLFSLNLRSSERINTLLERLEVLAQSKDMQKVFHQESFGPYKIYTLHQPAPAKGKAKPDNEMDAFKQEMSQIQVAVAGQNLIGTVGNNSVLLKRMMYLQNVLPADSRFHLSNQPRFQPVRESLQDKPLWGYLDLVASIKAFQAADVKLPEMSEIPDLPDLSKIPGVENWLGQLGGLGVGVDIQRQGLSFKSFLSPDWGNLTPRQQAYLKDLQARPEHPLTALMEYMPGDPLFVSMGQGLDQTILHPVPFDLPLEQWVPELTEANVSKAVRALFNLDYKKDFVPAIDGRFGFGFFEPEKPGTPPDLVMYLGIKNGKEAAFDQLMQKQFKVRPDAFAQELDKISAAATPASHTSAAQANMHTFQTIVETYAVDWGGVYPANVTGLREEAIVTGREYWKDFDNPATGESGKGKSYDDYVRFNPQTDVRFAGMVFYQPVIDPANPEVITKYFVYSYDLDGTLHALSNDESPDILRKDLPKAKPFTKPAVAADKASDKPAKGQEMLPKLLENWHGIPIYELPIQALLQEFKAGEQLGKGDARTSSLKANMHTLQTIVETFGVDWGGVYPSDLKTLVKEAKKKGRDYWKDFANPITEQEGLGKSVADFTQNPGKELAGMVLYQPKGEVSHEDGKTFYSGYVIYGYAADGKLYALSNSDDFSDGMKKPVRTDLPKAKVPAEPDPLKDLDKIQLVFARKGNVWMLALNPAALKTAMSDKGRPPHLEQMVQATGSEDANSMFFLDLETTVKLVKGYLPDDLSKSDEYKEIDAALKPWKSLFATARQVPDKGSEGQFVLNADLAKIDLEALSKWAGSTADDMATAGDRAKTSSLKANMFTLQTIVETYAVDWGGCYAENMQALEFEAKVEGREYWKDVTNPFRKDGKGFVDFTQFKPGAAAAGQALYQPKKSKDGCIVKYRIFGADKKGQLLQDKGKDFFLSNS